MRMTRIGGMAVLLAMAVTVSGCSTVRGLGDRLNPFDKDEPQAVAGEGQRISIIAFDEKVAVADALKGQDFYLPPAAPQADWPVSGGGEPTVEHVQAAANLQIAWKRGFGKGSDREQHLMAPPVSAGGRIFVMDADSRVSALDAGSGAVVWRQDMPDRGRRDRHAFGGGLAFADGKLYVSSGARYVAQLDAATGALGWRRDTSSPIHSAPIVAAGRLFVVSTDNELLAFNAATGAPDWNYQALVEPARIMRASTPAVAGETIVAGFASGEVVALRAGNGNDLWNQALSRASRTNALSEIRDVAGRPVIYKGDVYAASHSGVFAAIDLRSGQPRWTLPVSSVTSPWTAGDVVYIVSRAGEVICVARESGQVYWIRDLNEGRRPKNRKGSLLRRAKQAPLWTTPILASDRLILASSEGDLVALNPKTGETTATSKVGGSVLIDPIAVGGVLYIVTDEAELVAVR